MNTLNDIYNCINSILEEMGFVLYVNTEDDYSINDYITDSIQFIDFIVRIEDKMSMELPDEFLDLTSLLSARGFSNKIWDYYMTL